MVRSPDSPAASQSRTTFQEKDTPVRSARRYRFDWLGHMSVARSAMGRYRLPVVQCKGIWLLHRIRLDPITIHCDANERPKQVSLHCGRTLATTNLFSCTVPLYLFRNRTVCAASGFMMFLQLAITVQTYYWPIYFQSVKDTSAKDSGIYMFPFCISSMFSTLAAGWITSKVGYYVPFMWIGAPILATGAGLFGLLSAHSPASSWAGYQIVSGIGYGICGQIPILAVQVVLEKEDVPTGCVFVIFFECLGGALATSIAQNLFTDNLLKNLRGIDGVDGAAVVAAGAKDFRRLIRPELLDKVIDAFGDALRNVFLLALASSIVALVISAAMEWRRLPRDTKDSDPGSEST